MIWLTVVIWEPRFIYEMQVSTGSIWELAAGEAMGIGEINALFNGDIMFVIVWLKPAELLILALAASGL